MIHSKICSRESLLIPNVQAGQVEAVAFTFLGELVLVVLSKLSAVQVFEAGLALQLIDHALVH